MAFLQYIASPVSYWIVGGFYDQENALNYTGGSARLKEMGGSEVIPH